VTLLFLVDLVVWILFASHPLMVWQVCLGLQRTENRYGIVLLSANGLVHIQGGLWGEIYLSF